MYKPDLLMNQRRDRMAWLEASLQLLAEQGHEALTIERVCKVLQVTKGSFYHHFANVDAWHNAIAAYWLARDTHAILRPIGSRPEEVRAQIEAIQAFTLQLPHNLELAFRVWAARNPQLAEQVRQVDQQRLQYLIDLDMALGFPAEQAQVRAYLAYAGYLGATLLHQWLDDNIKHKMATLQFQVLYPDQATAGPAALNNDSF